MNRMSKTFKKGDAVAKVFVQYSGTKEIGQTVNTTNLAAKVSKSTQTALGTSSFTTLVDQPSLMNVKPSVVLATTTTRRVSILISKDLSV